ncbi:hypothetical protein C8Q73DRAFT_787273 [Cubamyces lactineus]|nr:hypothetical protein C8Q73DRAFT_787273 [Cubamyces lactineus]
MPQYLSYIVTVTTKRKEDNPWQPLLEALKTKSSVAPRPRQLAIWQLYMSKKPEEIDIVYKERWPQANLPSTRSLSFRAAIARELLAQESEEYREELNEEAIRMHEEELAELQALQLPQADPNDEQAMRSAREEFAAVVQPLLQLLRDYTGMYCTLIAGVPLLQGPKEFDLRVVGCGRTAGPLEKPWHAMEEAAFKKDVMYSFTRFLMNTPEWYERVKNVAGTATPASGSSVADPMGSAMSALGLQLSELPHGSSRPAVSQADGKHPARRSKRKGRGSRRSQRKGIYEDDDWETESSNSDWDSDSSESTSTSDPGSGDGDQGSESSDDDMPSDVPTPTLEELGFGAAMAERLAQLSSTERRQQLFRFTKLSAWERSVENRRAENAALAAQFNVQLQGAAARKSKQKGARPAKKAKTGEATAAPRRTADHLDAANHLDANERLDAAHQLDAADHLTAVHYHCSTLDDDTEHLDATVVVTTDC